MFKYIHYVCVSALVLTMFSGCTRFHKTELANQAKSDMLGMSKVDLYECAGVPSKRDTVEGVEFISYVSRGISTDSKGKVEERSCEAVFQLQDGSVVNLKYYGDGHGGLMTKKYNLLPNQCYQIIEGCLH